MPARSPGNGGPSGALGAPSSSAPRIGDPERGQSAGPRSAPPRRPPVVVEEVSTSALLPADDARESQAEAEELSGSVLVDELRAPLPRATDPIRQGPPVSRRLPAPIAASRKPPTVPPPFVRPVKAASFPPAEPQGAKRTAQPAANLSPSARLAKPSSLPPRTTDSGVDPTRPRSANASLTPQAPDTTLPGTADADLPSRTADAALPRAADVSLPPRTPDAAPRQAADASLPPRTADAALPRLADASLPAHTPATQIDPEIRFPAEEIHDTALTLPVGAQSARDDGTPLFDSTAPPEGLGATAHADTRVGPQPERSLPESIPRSEPEPGGAETIDLPQTPFIAAVTRLQHATRGIGTRLAVTAQALRTYLLARTRGVSPFLARILARTREVLASVPTQKQKARFLVLTRELGVRLRALVTNLSALARGNATLEEPGGKDSRAKWILPAVALAGLSIGVVVVVFSLARRHPTDPQHSVPGAFAGPVVPDPSSVHSIPGSNDRPILAPCVVAGSPKVIAPSALVTAGVELRALGGDVLVGFAASDRQAESLRLDPNTLSVISRAAALSSLTIARVTPGLSSNGLPLAMVDTDGETDGVRGRRTIATVPPLQVGASGDAVVWSRLGGAAAGRLWPIDGEIEAVRGVPDRSADASTTAIAFRRSGGVEVGLVTGRDMLTALGELRRFAGLAGSVGAPAIALSDGVVLLAWADRPSGAGAWQLRSVRFKVGGPSTEPTLFTPPPGGKGEQAMSPSVVALPGNRFLLVWTEGPPTRHDLRAITLSESGAVLGEPLELSNPGANAGQGQAALAGGHGVAAFLESTEGGGFRLAATPISCGP